MKMNVERERETFFFDKKVNFSNACFRFSHFFFQNEMLKKRKMGSETLQNNAIQFSDSTVHVRQKSPIRIELRT